MSSSIRPRHHPLDDVKDNIIINPKKNIKQQDFAPIHIEERLQLSQPDANIFSEPEVVIPQVIPNITDIISNAAANFTRPSANIATVHRGDLRTIHDQLDMLDPVDTAYISLPSNRRRLLQTPASGKPPAQLSREMRELSNQTGLSTTDLAYIESLLQELSALQTILPAVLPEMTFPPIVGEIDTRNGQYLLSNLNHNIETPYYTNVNPSMPIYNNTRNSGLFPHLRPSNGLFETLVTSFMTSNPEAIDYRRVDTSKTPFPSVNSTFLSIDGNDIGIPGENATEIIQRRPNERSDDFRQRQLEHELRQREKQRLDAENKLQGSGYEHITKTTTTKTTVTDQFGHKHVTDQHTTVEEKDRHVGPNRTWGDTFNSLWNTVTHPFSNNNTLSDIERNMSNTIKSHIPDQNRIFRTERVPIDPNATYRGTSLRTIYSTRNSGMFPHLYSPENQMVESLDPSGGFFQLEFNPYSFSMPTLVVTHPNGEVQKIELNLPDAANHIPKDVLNNIIDSVCIERNRHISDFSTGRYTPMSFAHDIMEAAGKNLLNKFKDVFNNKINNEISSINHATANQVASLEKSYQNKREEVEKAYKEKQSAITSCLSDVDLQLKEAEKRYAAAQKESQKALAAQKNVLKQERDSLQQKLRDAKSQLHKYQQESNTIHQELVSVYPGFDRNPNGFNVNNVTDGLDRELEQNLKTLTQNLQSKLAELDKQERLLSEQDSKDRIHAKERYEELVAQYKQQRDKIDADRRYIEEKFKSSSNDLVQKIANERAARQEEIEKHRQDLTLRLNNKKKELDNVLKTFNDDRHSIELRISKLFNDISLTEKQREDAILRANDEYARMVEEYEKQKEHRRAELNNAQSLLQTTIREYETVLKNNHKILLDAQQKLNNIELELCFETDPQTIVKTELVPEVVIEEERVIVPKREVIKEIHYHVEMDPQLIQSKKHYTSSSSSASSDETDYETSRSNHLNHSFMPDMMRLSTSSDEYSETDDERGFFGNSQRFNKSLSGSDSD